MRPPDYIIIITRKTADFPKADDGLKHDHGQLHRDVDQQQQIVDVVVVVVLDGHHADVCHACVHVVIRRGKIS
jgi:methylmalonyl-CoA mutase cobalamin-binding subunit